MRVAVIGGGVGGLAAAHRIGEQVPGADVVVLEAAPRAGGVLRSDARDGWLLEHAANAMLAGPPDGAVALCRELGVALEEPSEASRNRWVYVRGALHKVPTGPRELATTTLLSRRARLRLVAEPLRPARALGPDADRDESVFDFAARRLGEEVARTLAAPLVAGVFAGDAREISVVAGFPRLAALEARGGLVRGLLAARRDAADRERPRSLAPRGGMEALVRALAARLGPRLRLGLRATAVTPAAGGVDVAVEGAGVERVDAAVLAVPGWALPPLVPAVPELAARAAAIPYAPAAVVHVGLRRGAAAHPLDGFGALVAEGEAPRALGVVFESAVWAARAPDGHALVRCIYGGTRDPSALELDDAALIALAREDLEALIGLPPDAAPALTHVVRWPRGIPQYRLGHAAAVAAADELARGHRLVLAGAAWHGPAVTDGVTDAQRVAREVARWR